MIAASWAGACAVATIVAVAGVCRVMVAPVRHRGGCFPHHAVSELLCTRDLTVDVPRASGIDCGCGRICLLQAALIFG